MSKVTIKSVRKAAITVGMMAAQHNGRIKLWAGHAARDFHEGGELANLGSAREAIAFIEGWNAHMIHVAREG